MILISVIIGYLLGMAPYIYKEIKEIIIQKQENKIQKNETTEMEKILDEYLNGAKEEDNTKINQEDIFEEYITGKVTKGE